VTMVYLYNDDHYLNIIQVINIFSTSTCPKYTSLYFKNKIEKLEEQR